MAVRVPLEYANETMRLARPVCDADGRVMAGSGSVLTPSVLRILRRLAIQTVVVEDSASIAGWEEIRTLGEEVARLHERLGPVADGRRNELRAALERRLARRERRLADGADRLPEPDPAEAPRRGEGHA